MYHPAIVIDILESQNFEKTNSRKISDKHYNLRSTNFIALYNELFYLDWPFLKNTVNVDEAVTSLYNIFHRIFDIHVPKFKSYKRSHSNILVLRTLMALLFSFLHIVIYFYC